MGEFVFSHFGVDKVKKIIKFYSLDVHESFEIDITP